MALGMATVMSPVGVNTEIIDQGVNGFLVSGKEEWKSKLQLLLENPALRMQLGNAGRKTIEERYSVKANSSKYIKLFND
jgi:glycosyltransferase involved in cell wall biosynthesis